MSCVYVLHIDPPLGHARHYTGFTVDDTPDRRLQEHRRGKGSRMLAAAVASGRSLTVAHVFAGEDRRFEAWLHTRGDTSRWCPECGSGNRPLPTRDSWRAQWVDGKTKRSEKRKRNK